MLSLDNYNPAGRFCQQSVEKIFKHHLELCGDPAEKYIFSSHSLRRLYEAICKAENVEVDKALKSDLVDLTDYYFDTNYPCDFNKDLTREEAEAAVKLTETVHKWVEELSR